MMTDKEILAVVQAHIDGKTVEYSDKSRGIWKPIGKPSWDFSSDDYRVKPEPRVWWLNIYPTGVYPHTTRESADVSATQDRLECVRVVEAPE